MDSDALLQTHAEVAIALAGFASVIAALSRPLNAFERQRFLSLLGLALIQILGCLLPLWLVRVFESSAGVWRLLSFVLLALNLARMWWLVFLPTRTLGGPSREVFNPLASRVIFGSGMAGFTCFAVNAIGIAITPGFDLYYTGMLTTLLVGFALFADVVTRES